MGIGDELKALFPQYISSRHAQIPIAEVAVGAFFYLKDAAVADAIQYFSPFELTRDATGAGVFVVSHGCMWAGLGGLVLCEANYWRVRARKARAAKEDADVAATVASIHNAFMEVRARDALLGHELRQILVQALEKTSGYRDIQIHASQFDSAQDIIPHSKGIPHLLAPQRLSVIRRIWIQILQRLSFTTAPRTARRGSAM